MNNAELIQQIATLNWLLKENPSTPKSSQSGSSSILSGSGEENARQLFLAVTGARVLDEIYQRVSHKREIEQAEAAVILRIADYVKQHPRASEKELTDVVRREILAFQEYVKNLS